MFGRIDLTTKPCNHCNETGKDPKKRTRACPVCSGSKRKSVCATCGEDMPCSGTDNTIFDQSFCNNKEPRRKVTMPVTRLLACTCGFTARHVGGGDFTCEHCGKTRTLEKP